MRQIVILATPDAQILDTAGPYQIFVRAAERSAGRPPYAVQMATTTKTGSVRTNCGLVLGGGVHYRSIRGPIDTLLVAGGTGAEEVSTDEALLRWIRAVAPRVRRLGSICTGAFVLAAAGLLDGKRAATHWKWAEELAARFPKVSVDPDPIYICDGDTYTSAGVTAGMDLALALVEQDLGSEMALIVAREMVLYLRRPGGQSQFSTALALQAADRKQIADVRTWAIDHLDADLTVETLATRAGMSARNFARAFLKNTGTTPARFVERLRVEAARRRLEESRDKLEKIASDCGFGSIQRLRRSFHRVLRVHPHEYRLRFTEAS